MIKENFLYLYTSKDIFNFCAEYYFSKFPEEVTITRPNIINLMFLLWMDYYNKTNSIIFNDSIFVKNPLGFSLSNIHDVSLSFEISKFNDLKYNIIISQKHKETFTDILDKYFYKYKIEKRIDETFSYFIYDIIIHKDVYNKTKIDQSIMFEDLIKYCNTKHFYPSDTFFIDNYNIYHENRSLLQYNKKTKCIEAKNALKKYKNDVFISSICKDIIRFYDIYNNIVEAEETSENIQKNTNEIKKIKNFLYILLCNLNLMFDKYILENKILEKNNEQTY